MRVVNHHSERQLQLLADQEPRAAIAKRLRTIVLAKRSYTAPEIATCTGFSRRVVQAWVARYNGEGLAGLETKAGRGRKPPLTPEEADQLQQRLDAGPLPDDGVCTLRGKDVQRILESEFGQLRSLNAVYGLLHRLGYSSLVPRPQHPQTDPAAQEEFKKNWRAPRGDPDALSRPPAASLSRRRSAVRPARYADSRLGQNGFATPCRAANAVRIRLCPGRDVCRDGAGRRADFAAAGHGHRESVSRPILGNARTRRAGGAGLGRRRLPSGERSTLPIEHHVDDVAAVLAGAESSRESVALPAEPSLVEPKIRHRG